MSMTTPQRLAQNIRYLMVRDGISQAELAVRSDLDAAALSRAMNGKRKWTTDDLDAIASVFKIGTGDLFDEAENLIRSRWFSVNQPELEFAA